MDVKPYQPNNLDDMLRRFFDGETTCAEDKMLEQYFCSNPDIPQNYLQYRNMFCWYASGMDETKLPTAPVSAVKMPRLTKQIVVWWTSVAAALALLIGLGYNVFLSQSTFAPRGSYIVRDSYIITGTDEIESVIDATFAEGNCLEDEIDFKMSVLGIDKDVNFE